MNHKLFINLMHFSVKHRLQTVDCRMQTKSKRMTKGEMQTAEFLSIYRTISIIEC